MSKPTDKKTKQKAPDLVVRKDEKDSNGGNGAANASAREEIRDGVVALDASQTFSGEETAVLSEGKDKNGSTMLELPKPPIDPPAPPPSNGGAQTADPASPSPWAGPTNKAKVSSRAAKETAPASKDPSLAAKEAALVAKEAALVAKEKAAFAAKEKVDAARRAVDAAREAVDTAREAVPGLREEVRGERDAAPTERESVPVVVDPLVGHVLDGKYEITRALGHGGMSVVYEAKHLLMNKVVALKLMHRHLHHSDKAVRRFQKEAQAVATLSHDGVIRIYDFGVTTDGSPFIAMEFLSGKSLSDYSKAHGRLEEESATAAFKKIAESLAHAHEKGIIHRDLKPSNVVLTEPEDPSGPIKTTVVDFGIAKMTGEDTGEHMAITTTGEVFGSPLYMSPEQCAGRKLDQRSDIYSFGCLMYEAVTGKTPFEGKNAVALFHSHQKNEAPKFSTLAERPNISEGLEGIILKCLEKHPLDRYQSMQEVVKAIDELAGDAAVPVLTRMRRKESLIFMLTALLAVGIASPILASMWHLFLGQVAFFLLVFVVTASSSYSMYYKFFEMKRTMELRTQKLNMPQKAKLSFTLLSAVLMSIWSVGMMFYIAAKGTQNPFIDALAQSLWIGSVFLVALYIVGMIIFAGYTAIMALSKEST